MGDDPTEEAQEHIHHEAAHGHGPKWITWAALTAALLAVLAAVSASMSSSYLTESTLKRIEANDQWNFYQAKSIKRSIIDSRDMEYNQLDPSKIPPAVHKQHQDDISKKAEYATKVEDDNPEDPKGLLGIQARAISLQDISEKNLKTHETFENSETLFHIAIAVVAIAVVAKRKEFWYMSIVGGVVGLWFFGAAFAKAPHEKLAKENSAAMAEHATNGDHATGATAPASEHH
jgi:hypothetical protein